MKKLTLSLLLVAAVGFNQAQAHIFSGITNYFNPNYAHLDGTPTPLDRINDIAIGLSDGGVDASIGVVKGTCWESGNKSTVVKFGFSLSLMKLLQGKIALNDLLSPSFDLETSLPGCNQKLGLKLKLFTLLSYAKIFSTIKLPGDMNEFLTGLSKKFGAFIKKSDKAVAAGLLIYFALNNCGGAEKIIKGDAKTDKSLAKKRMMLSALLAGIASYGIRNYIGAAA